MAWAFLFLIGVISAVFGSIVGLGGGIITVPALVYLGPSVLGKEFPAALAVGTSLTVLIFTAISSTLTYVKQGRVDFRSGLLFFTTSGPAAVIGATLTQQLKLKQFELAFGLFLLLMAMLLIVRSRLKPLPIRWKINRTYTDAAGISWEYGYSLTPALAVGFAVGFISGLFGIGGGALFVPLMVLLFRYPPHVATATSMFVIFLSAIMGSITHAWHGEVDWLSVAVLAPGALFGGWLGARIAAKMSGNALLWLLRLTLIALALRMIWSGAQL